MEEKRESLVRNNLTRQIKSFSVEKGDLHQLFNILRERNNAAGDIELAKFKKMDQTDEVYEKNKKFLKESFELKLTVSGTDGRELYGSVSEIFDSPNFPDDLGSIFVSSDITLHTAYNLHARNYFQLLLDFNKPQVLDLSFLPSQATPNASNICVTGYNATWVHGLFNEFNNFIDKHPSRLPWIHRHSVYDLLLYIFGLPFGFWMTYKLSGILNKVFGTFSVFIQSASYVYVFFVSLVIFRLLFHYARWIWPLVEYQGGGNRALKHRITLVALALGIISGVIYDVIKFII